MDWPNTKAASLALVNLGAAGKDRKSIVNSCVAATADPPAPVAVIFKFTKVFPEKSSGVKAIEAVPLWLSLKKRELNGFPVDTLMAVRVGTGDPVVVTRK